MENIRELAIWQEHPSGKDCLKELRKWRRLVWFSLAGVITGVTVMIGVHGTPTAFAGGVLALASWSIGFKAQLKRLYYHNQAEYVDRDIRHELENRTTP